MGKGHSVPTTTSTTSISSIHLVSGCLPFLTWTLSFPSTVFQSKVLPPYLPSFLPWGGGGFFFSFALLLVSLPIPTETGPKVRRPTSLTTRI